ncbi:MAG: peroxide stress protein YaaA [Ichthyobacteriaceae bacterium]|nr:peroxide stress protein YaaA [Ichthyobacteriaceae bacterium]
MIILISPAKNINTDTVSSNIKSTNAVFNNEANIIFEVLKSKTPKDLMDLMKISENLANLNWERNKKYNKGDENIYGKQAMFAFDGAVYKGISPNEMQETSINYLQSNLRILSGVYGLLKPLDLIVPYRLEMGTKLEVKSNKNLYEFWYNKITTQLNNELNENDTIINLASNEYFKALKTKTLKHKIITPVFKDYKNGSLKTISFYAKKARGNMVKHLSDNNYTSDIETIKQFNIDDYSYDSKLSDEKTFVFTR